MNTLYRTYDIFNFGSEKLNYEALLNCKIVADKCGLIIGKCYTDEETHGIYKLQLYGTKEAFVKYYFKTIKINISIKEGLKRFLNVLKWS